MDSLHIPSLLIGFVSGVAVCAVVFFIFRPGRIKYLAVAGFKIETHESPADAPVAESDEIELEIPIDGRWAILPSSGSLPRFSDAAELHGKVKIKRGENIRVFVGQGVTDADLRKLARLADNPVIRSLVFYRCGRLTSEGFRLLGGFQHVLFLDLSETTFSDTDIDPICNLRALKSLMIQKCLVSDQAIAKLKGALPNCDVRR
jgi:hypothetical protein